MENTAFGENYKQYYHKPMAAIKYLLQKQQGQVIGALEHKVIGDIALVWGQVVDKDRHRGYGLAHILDKRTYELEQMGLSKIEAQKKAKDFIMQIPLFVKNGTFVKDKKGRMRIEYKDFVVGIKDNWQGQKTHQWVITTYSKKGEA